MFVLTLKAINTPRPYVNMWKNLITSVSFVAAVYCVAKINTYFEHEQEIDSIFW